MLLWILTAYVVVLIVVGAVIWVIAAAGTLWDRLFSRS